MKLNSLVLNFLILFLGISNYSIGQEDMIMVVSCQGKAQYNSTDGTAAIDLIPGLDLDSKGSVFVDQGARLRLIVKQKSVLLTGPGRYDLQELYEANTKKSMSFSSRFWNFVVSGMGSTKDKKDLVKYHREFMQSHGDIKGFAQEGSTVQLSPLVRGNIATDEVTFKWTLNNDVKSSKFRIVDDKRVEIYSNNVDSNALTLNLNELSLNLDGTYTWVVSVEKNDVIHSAELSFRYIPHKQSEILEKLLYLDEYIAADPQEKLWLKTVMLEMEGYFYEADSLYRNLLEQDEGNLFLKKSYALFLCRQNQVQKATSIL